MITIFLISFQWYLITKQMGKRIPFKEIFHINMYGSFVETITPAVKAGGEAIKVVMLKNHGISYSKAIAIVSCQKLISMLPFLFLYIVSIIWFSVSYSTDHVYWGVIIKGFSLILFIILGFIFVIIFSDRLNPLINYLPVKFKNVFIKFQTWLLQFKKEIKKSLYNRKNLAINIILSFAIWLFFPVKAYLLAILLGLDITFVQSAVVIFLTYVIAMIPVSPGGLGTFEGSGLFLLSLMDISLHLGFIYILIFRFSSYWFVFLIGAIYIAGSNLGKFVNSVKTFN